MFKDHQAVGGQKGHCPGNCQQSIQAIRAPVQASDVHRRQARIPQIGLQFGQELGDGKFIFSLQEVDDRRRIAHRLSWVTTRWVSVRPREVVLISTISKGPGSPEVVTLACRNNPSGWATSKAMVARLMAKGRRLS